MKAWSLCLLLLILPAKAQRAGDPVSIARLNADLMPLKSGLPEQSQVMRRFAIDVNQLYPRGFVTRNVAKGLTGVLAGKDLTDSTLTPLTSAILGVIDSAFDCRDDSTELRNSIQFRASIEQAYYALIALDVSVPNSQAAVGLLYSAAYRVAHPIVRPIPPVYRPNR